MDIDISTEPEPSSGISTRNSDDATVLTLWGEVDAALREAASDAMAALAVRGTVRPIVLDVRDVTFIDSSGIAFILQVYMLGQETGTPVRLRDPSDAVSEVLEMVGMGGRIPVDASEPTGRVG
ncbi:STAS domain-containing protein [Isoptericola sp. NEAU-Y5]|uniref:Anti-sigma factor antagonist n=1 Tax=Isoptericola luteus TaxID=2879484 RepID=A0ABS7ZJB0_9MICO|nr:STAS domain-containing protein [Isoptericola sp. NEAU-Y5]MCA5891774.1 STAS domain-containing protein [Isoptericola sp. NEAU-Y5]MCA5894607.1 STAS domain-containing protein [Isoptericola sp. NEAU-Y5]